LISGLGRGGLPWGGGRGRCFGGAGRGPGLNAAATTTPGDEAESIRAEIASAKEAIAALEARLAELDKKQ